MYPVSKEYQKAISESSRSFFWTGTITTKAGKKYTIKAANELFSEKDEIIENTKTMMDMVCNTDDLDKELGDKVAELNIIAEQIESKKAQRELFKGFIRALEKQGTLVEEFDEGLWSNLVQEVVVNTKDDIRFIFKNVFEIKTR